MADGFDVDEIVSRFFLDTCKSRRKVNVPAMIALRWCANRMSIYDDGSHMLNPLVTGTCAELYIDTAWSCISDLDIMAHGSFELAIPAGSSPPTELPAEFDSRVKVYERYMKLLTVNTRATCTWSQLTY